MCAIIGALVWGINTSAKLERANNILDHIVEESHERGRDGRGFMINSSADFEPSFVRSVERKSYSDLTNILKDLCSHATIIGNLRAEPTTEYVEDKELFDQQPYAVMPWATIWNTAPPTPHSQYCARLPADHAARPRTTNPMCDTDE